MAMPVDDLDAAQAFYVDVLGCRVGRVAPDWVDIWFYGAQVTLHHRPTEVLPKMVRGVRHFGVALTTEAWEELVDRYRRAGVVFVDGPRSDGRGGYKAKVEDPSGNVIEFKAYPDLELLLSPPQGEAAPT